jgi:antitoxin Phd
MNRLSISDTRNDLARAVDSSSRGAVEITRHGHTVAVIVGAEQYRKLQEAWEEMEDIKAFDEALADSAPHIPWEEVKAELGL